jgi:hypothetical protein
LIRGRDLLTVACSLNGNEPRLRSAVSRAYYAAFSEDGFVIASDIIIASLAMEVGFQVEKVAIARRPRRRNVASRFLRESVVFLRKPEETAS